MFSLLLILALGMVASAAALASALLRNPVYAVLSLVVTMVAWSGIYFSLGSEYIGIIQVIVYAGAVLVLFLFVVMLIGLQKEDIPPLPKGSALYAPVLLVTLGLGAITLNLRHVSQLLSLENTTPYLYNSLEALSKPLFLQYLLPFEILSVLILIGLLGATLLTTSAS
ncbi:MAG: NADH-quinone oxidoreductase subunit J [Bacteroidia bacterium]